MTRVASLLAALVIAPPLLLLLSRIEVLARSSHPAERFDALRREIPLPVAPSRRRIVRWAETAYAEAATALATSRRSAPSFSRARMSKSTETLGSAASIFATLDWLEPMIRAT